MTAKVQSRLFTGRAVSKGNMVVRNVVEEMNFFLLQQKTGSNRVDWRVSPALVEEAAVHIERLEEVDIGL